MEFLFAVFRVLLLIPLFQLSKTNSLCKPDPNTATFNCESIPLDLLKQLDWPQPPCMLTTCTNCVTAIKTFILTEDGFLIEPSQFFDRPTARTGNVSSFTCALAGEPRGDAIALPCDCDKNCTGSAEFCSSFHCDEYASCWCEVSRVKYELSHSSMGQSSDILNPTLISIEHCLYKHSIKIRSNQRKLLEFESATFSLNNLTLQFLDPVVTVPESGKLIARVSGNELIIDVKDDLNLVLPIEFTAFKDKLTLIFIASTGKATISQLACPQNYYCAWGDHCKPNTKFEALPEESLDYPGVTNCHPSSVGSGCTIISRMGCLFYRVYFVPDLLHSYEVRTILGHHCTYTIEVERAQNGTKELLTLQTTAQTADGIHIEILGSYNQAPPHITDSLVLRVGDPSEAYLIQTSPHGRPIAGMVGHIQSNTSYTKKFIFDKDMVRCDFFETTLRCETIMDGLTAMTRTKDRALPLTRDLHLLTIDKGILKSRLLSTAPVRLQLTFKNFQISIENHDVCPKITSTDIRTKGCYSCQILATMSLTAVSNCHAGTVAVEFQSIQLFTQTLFLGTEPKEFTIQFIAEQKCYDEKICLASKNMKHCHVFSFCLNEPSVNLIQLNTSYTRSFFKQDTAYPGFFGFFSLPTVNTIFMSLKMIGGLLLIFCLTITIVSTCITCCRR